MVQNDVEALVDFAPAELVEPVQNPELPVKLHPERAPCIFRGPGSVGSAAGPLGRGAALLRDGGLVVVVPKAPIWRNKAEIKPQCGYKRAGARLISIGHRAA